MGLTIYYKGTFHPKASLPEMIDEVRDIAEIYKWKYHIFEREFPKQNFKKNGSPLSSRRGAGGEMNENIYGILFTPHKKSEPVWLCFLSNGVLGSPTMLEHWLNTKEAKHKRLIPGNFTKTQYAGPDVHKLVIDLLRYLSKKYFQKFSLIDESKYWETKDEKLMRHTFNEWNAMMDNFAYTLKTVKPRKKESLESVIKRAARKVHARRKK